MSGAGSGGAGLGGAGVGLSAPELADRPTRPPWGLTLDPTSRDFVVDENGRYVECNPIDHQAMMRLIPALATIKVAPTQGGPWKSLEIADEATMTRRFEEHIHEAWRDLINLKHVRLVKVRARPTLPLGRGRYEIVWMNLRDPQDPNRTTSI